ncbi:MAG TPA: hypothetical protein VHE33_14740 [Acidobacteriaceae bacterium]|nr:hypothetical protein [Acidobacteriaceae bacterium]
MPYQIQDFEREYAGKSNDDLLRLAWAPQDLVDDAKIALQTEMGRRGLKSADIDAARFEKEREEEREERKAANRMLQTQWRGIGFQRFCKWDRTYDPDSQTEEFTTTRFFILFQLPLIPLATFRVRRRKGIFQKLHILETLPLNWAQVLWVWMLTLLAILALFLLARYGLPLLDRHKP